MLSRRLTLALTVITALLSVSCSVSRQATERFFAEQSGKAERRVESSELREARDSLREEISQNLNENLTEHEVVTWTVTGLPLTAYGLQERDTLKVERVTHRELESGSRFKAQSSKVEVRTVRDTVYIEKRDSSLRVSSLGAYGLREDGTPTVSGKLSAVSKVLKWIFWILIGLIGLIITVKVCSLRR